MWIIVQKSYDFGVENLLTSMLLEAISLCRVSIIILSSSSSCTTPKHVYASVVRETATFCDAEFLQQLQLQQQQHRNEQELQQQ